MGTGKSFIYENISPHVRLVSGGNISPAVLSSTAPTAFRGFWRATPRSVSSRAAAYTRSPATAV
ncbi:MAG: hypothetical protein NTX57_00585 [Armatimonadetes bacterium]|nr:hypothetical protein [Armatimonadota bacterium]